MIFTCIFTLILVSLVEFNAQEFLYLQDDSLKATFLSAESGSSFMQLVGLNSLHSGSSSPNIVETACTAPVWSVEYVVDGAKGVHYVSSLNVSTRSILYATNEALIAQWVVPLADEVPSRYLTMILNTTLYEGQLLLTPSFSFDGQSTAIWTYTLFAGGCVKVSKASSIFQNTGFGIVMSPPVSFNTEELLEELGNPPINDQYPSQTTQYMAAYGPNGNASSIGIYVAAHDPHGSSKAFSCAVENGTQAVFYITVTPPGAGLLGDITPSFPVVVTVFDGDWYDAAVIYREWALPNADWTQQGPLIDRDDSPQWMLDVNVWINSHWQENDIFNTSGGDPDVVLERVTNIVNRFGLSESALAFHWYEWDTLGYALGSNYSVCESEVTCGFDTHYPEYFPTRVNFNETLRELQSMGVRVTPYINGRIVDQGTASWINAKSSAAKDAWPSFGAKNLSLYDEEYGSEALFAVMCPHTSYWQDILADIVVTLTNEYNTDGVYIDQIACAGPRPCWDSSHNHTLGGGHHWVDGYDIMLSKMQEAMISDKVLLTESNAEPFMAGVNIFLTLVGFRSGDLPMRSVGKGSGQMIVPAFQAVYGGYVLCAGAEFYQEDLTPNPDVFAAKITNQFMFGASMGWFSLGGRDNQVPPMGLYEMLMDPAYDPEIQFLSTLSLAKTQAARFFNFGRIMRFVPLTVNGTDDALLRTMEMKQYARLKQGKLVASTVYYPPVMASAWLAYDEQSLLISIATVERSRSATIAFNIDLTYYGFPDSSSSKFKVVSMPYDGSKPEDFGQFPGTAVHVKLHLGARDVMLLHVQPMN